MIQSELIARFVNLLIGIARGYFNKYDLSVVIQCPTLFKELCCGVTTTRLNVKTSQEGGFEM